MDHQDFLQIAGLVRGSQIKLVLIWFNKLLKYFSKIALDSPRRLRILSKSLVRLAHNWKHGILGSLAFHVVEK